jgi:hypothetical protein
MKKLNFSLLLMFIGFMAFGQGFRAGVNIGIPTSDTQDLHSFVLGVDLNFLWEVSANMNFGIAAGYSNFFGEEVDFGSFGIVDIDDAGFLTLAGAGRLILSDQFVIGADVGYALAITPDDSEGGFYYMPNLGYNLSEVSQITVSYRHIETDDDSFVALLAGINFSLN